MQPIFVCSTQRITVLQYTYGGPHKVQPIFVRSTQRIARLHYTYGCRTLSTANIHQLYLHNHCFSLVLWVCNLNCSPCWLRLPTESLGHTGTYGCPTLSAAYVSWLYLPNKWDTLHLWVSSFKCILFFLGVVTQSLSQNTLMGAPSSVETIFVSSAYRTTGLQQTYECLTLSAAQLGYYP